MKKLLLLASFIFIVSCTHKNENQQNNKLAYEEIELIDKFTNQLHVGYTDKLTVAEIAPIYIGEIKKEIKLSYQIYNTVEKYTTLKKYKYPKQKALEVFIDTTRIIGMPMGLYEFSKTEQRNNKMAHPIFVKNVSTDTLVIGFAEYLPLIIEAKNKKGEWKPIQERMKFMCGTGITHFYCPPNNIVICAMQKQGGKFKTKLRLKYESISTNSTIYSNEINGEINENQFFK